MEATSRIIAVGVDESEGAAHALRWAVADAARRGATVRAVMAWTYLDQPARPGTARHFDPGFGEAAARAVLDDILHERLGDAADALERIAVNDHAGPALVGQAHDADLLVVGARGLGLVKSAVLGSVSNYCLHHASTPVAIIGTHAAETIAESVGPVVVGTDGSPAADVALAWAIDDAIARRATLQIVVAWSLPVTGAVPMIDMAPFAAGAEEVLARAVAAAHDAGVGRVKGATTCGNPGQALVAASVGASVTVVGTRGHGGFASLLLGSTSQQVAAHAESPVVVVPSTRDRAH